MLMNYVCSHHKLKYYHGLTRRQSLVFPFEVGSFSALSRLMMIWYLPIKLFQSRVTLNNNIRMVGLTNKKIDCPVCRCMDVMAHQSK